MKRFSKKEIFSIPNLMGYFRILLIPVFCYLYITAETEREYLYAALVVLLSSLTDLFDGKIARRFHMVTELGKALDPIADKLTHAALAICLATRYPMMWVLIALMLVKEGYMGVMGLIFLKKGKTTWVFADEFYLLFRYQYSADFFYRLYKRIRKYHGFVTSLTQNVEELLKSDTARLMLANSEFLILLNQAATDRDELASLLNISENQLSYITNVGAGKGLIRCSGNLVPFENSFPKNTKLYRLMTTKPGEC